VRLVRAAGIGMLGIGTLLLLLLGFGAILAQDLAWRARGNDGARPGLRGPGRSGVLIARRGAREGTGRRGR
jgi:hypothetical protein